jgi:hypothetical protein
MTVLVDYKLVLVVNLRTEKVCEMLHYDFRSLLGMFFVNLLDSHSTNDDLIFSLVFRDKLVYFRISLTGGQGQQERVFEFRTLKFENEVLNFNYNDKYSVLCIEKKDRNFNFFNLSTEKYLTKVHNFVYPYKNNKNFETRSSISNFFGLFKRSSKKEIESPLLENKSKESIYKKNQFFLEIL